MHLPYFPVNKLHNGLEREEIFSYRIWYSLEASASFSTNNPNLNVISVSRNLNIVSSLHNLLMYKVHWCIKHTVVLG